MGTGVLITRQNFVDYAEKYGNKLKLGINQGFAGSTISVHIM